MPRRNRWIATLVPLALLLVAAGCGDTTEDDESASEPAGQPEQAACDEPVAVAIPEFSFDPDPVSVAAGCEVVWENTHDQPHTSTGDGEQTWKTGNVAPGDTSDPVAFPDAGEFTYLCSLHPFMKGTVVVEG